MACSLSNLLNNFSEKFIELNVIMDMLTENLKYAEINKKVMSAFLNTQTLNMI